MGWVREKEQEKKGGDGGGKDLEDLRVTDRVGSCICGFVYDVALRWYWERKQRQRVVFLHVPVLEGQVPVTQGVDAVLRLIKALCEQVE